MGRIGSREAHSPRLGRDLAQAGALDIHRLVDRHRLRADRTAAGCERRLRASDRRRAAGLPDYQRPGARQSAHAHRDDGADPHCSGRRRGRSASLFHRDLSPAVRCRGACNGASPFFRLASCTGDRVEVFGGHGARPHRPARDAGLTAHVRLEDRRCRHAAIARTEARR